MRELGFHGFAASAEDNFAVDADVTGWPGGFQQSEAR